MSIICSHLKYLVKSTVDLHTRPHIMMTEQRAARQITFRRDPLQHLPSKHPLQQSSFPPDTVFVNDSHEPCSPSCPASAVTSPRCSATAPPDSWDLTDKVLLHPGRVQGPLRRSSSVNIPLIKQSSGVPEILREDYVGYIKDSGPSEILSKRYRFWMMCVSSVCFPKIKFSCFHAHS